MKNYSSITPVILRDNTGELNFYIEDRLSDVALIERLIEENKKLNEANKRLTSDLEWSMNQIEIKDALLKQLAE